MNTNTGNALNENSLTQKYSFALAVHFHKTPRVRHEKRSMAVKQGLAAVQKGAPVYLLFGEAQTPAALPWIANVEPLGKRCEDRGWLISPHSHPNFLQVVFVRSGRGHLTLDDAEIPFECPCVIIVPAKCIHGFKYQKDSDGWVLTVADYFLAQLLNRMPEFAQLTSVPQVLTLNREGEAIDRIRTCLLTLDREIRHKPVGYILAIETELCTVLLTLLRHSRALTSGTNHAHQKLVESFRKLVEERYRQSVSLPHLASELLVSPAQLRAACLKTLGLSPMQIVHERLMREAKRELLFGSMAIEHLAYWLGFSRAGYFNRFFKKRAGVTPGEFRQAHLRNAASNKSSPS